MPILKIALRSSIKVRPDESGAQTLERVHRLFQAVGLSDPLIRFSMADRETLKTSSVARILKRFPDMAAFDHARADAWAPKTIIRRLGNDIDTPGHGKPVDLGTLVEIMAGIPQSYPLWNAQVRLGDPLFGAEPDPGARERLFPGIIVSNDWGISRRSIRMAAVVMVDADTERADLPQLPAPVAAVLADLGKVESSAQIVLDGQRTAVVEAVRSILTNLKTDIAGLVQRARLPHAFDETDDDAPVASIGPRKPGLAKVFRTLGYECRGEGMMTLVCRRRTASNLIVELNLDMGSRGDHVSPTYRVMGLGFAAGFGLPVTSVCPERTMHWIVDARRWDQIVENLAALVAELERTFLPSVEAAAGPGPDWYRS